MRKKHRIPAFVRTVMAGLHRNGFEAYVVGGAVRDLSLGRKPRDWDLATNARPTEIERLFERTVPTGKAFGTVTVVINEKNLQVTTYRKERKYQDRRRPSEVEFVGALKEDLSRRDFTINAMAYDVRSARLIDFFGGLSDLQTRRLRAVGPARKRFSEDTLRAVRAARFIAELGLTPFPSLTRAGIAVSGHVSKISAERVRDELEKLLLAPQPSLGLRWLDRAHILNQLIPELTPLKNVQQGGLHQYDVFKHTILSIDAAPPDLTVRLALLGHDLAKPITRTRDRRGYHFYGHEKQGAEMAEKLLRRFRFPRQVIEDVVILIRHHLFQLKPLAQSDSAVRRFIRKVGDERVNRLLEVRKGDIRGCGPKRKISPLLRVISRKIADVRRAEEALNITDLAIDGRDVMRWLRIPPGPGVGKVLARLLESVLEHPELNNREGLRGLISKL